MSSSYLNMKLLRFSTAGSVDDGKSTLIGRLLYDSKSIFEDQYKNIKEASVRRGEKDINLAHLTDGLKAEREQGITIDVAYRYFSTPKRKFIIADTPGHIEYTRNMVTGASTSNLSIILIDARKGIVEQTKRHAFIASLLGIPHIIIAVNKMDLVDFNQQVFENIRTDFENFASRLKVKDVQFIPISALKGDNVVTKSENMNWYQGGCLLYLLENMHIGSDQNLIDCRFPVQNVIRPELENYPDYRGYAGRIASGVFKPGDDIQVLPSGFTSKIKSINTYDGEIDEAFAPMSVTLLLEDDIDVSRGDMIVRENNQPIISQDLELTIVWLNENKLNQNRKYAIKQTSNDTRCLIKEIRYKLNINTLHRDLEDKEIGMNEIARIAIRTTKPLFFDRYERNRVTGSLILIDEATSETVAAGIIL